MGHSPYYEIPDEYNAHLADVLERHGCKAAALSRPPLAPKALPGTPGRLALLRAELPLVASVAAVASIATWAALRSKC